MMMRWMKKEEKKNVNEEEADFDEDGDFDDDDEPDDDDIDEQLIDTMSDNQENIVNAGLEIQIDQKMEDLTQENTLPQHVNSSSKQNTES